MLSFFIEREKDKKIVNLDVEEITRNPNQPRKIFDEAALVELSNSIKEYGVMQPINVRKINDRYELISGERRLLASKLAGIKTIPAIVSKISDTDSAAMALTENIQRQNLNFIEEAYAFVSVMSEYNITQEELAKKIGKTQSTVANKVRILRLSDSMINKILENKLTERHARAILKITDDKLQDQVLDKIIKNKLNVDESEKLIKKILSNDKKPRTKIRYIVKDVKIFTNTIKKSVEIMKKSGIMATYAVLQKDNEYEINIRIPVNTD